MSERRFTSERIAALTGARAPEGEEWTVARVAAVRDADEQSLVFAEDEGSLAAAIASPASLILAGLALSPTVDRRVLPVSDPRYAFAVIARELSRDKVEDASSLVHPSASVDATAQVGERVRIGAGAVIEARAALGNDVVVGSNAVVAEGVILGERVVVQPGAVLGSRGFGYVRNRGTGEYMPFPQQGGLVIEDDVDIGANTTIDRGALEETRIGCGTKIDNLVHIGHNCRIGKNVIIAAQVGISGSCVIEDGAVLAGQVGISDHCHIGPGVILGGQAGVYRGKTVAGAGTVFAGTPAEPLREHMRGLARLRRLR